MTQLPLTAGPVSLADSVRAWAAGHDGAPLWELCEALPGYGASDIDAAAREVCALRWVDGKGYEVGLDRADGEEKRR